MTAVAVDEVWERLGAAARLLHHGALELWRVADDQGPASPLHSLGLGVYLTAAQLRALLPGGEEIPGLELDVEAGDLGALQLLTFAEELTRALPLHRPDLAGASQLVVELCDLIREARQLGC